MTQKDMENKIDDYFRERLLDYSSPAPENSWQVIDTRLKQKKTRMWWTIGLSMAASIALIISLSIGFFLGSRYQNKIADNNVIKKYVSNTNATDNSVKSHVETHKNIIDKENRNDKNNINKNNIIPQPILMVNNIHENTKKAIDPIKTVSEINYPSTNYEFIYKPLQARNGLLPVKSYSYKLAMSKSFCNTMLGMSNEEPVVEEPKKEYNWQLGGNAAPLYTYRNIAENSTNNSTSSYNKNEDALLAYAAGLTMNLEKKRWKFEVGVYFTKMGQQINDVYTYDKPDVTAMKDILPDNYVKLDVSTAAPAGNNITSISNSNGTIVQNNNNINADKNFVQNNALYEQNNFQNTPEPEVTTIEQQYSYIEVPLIAHYKVIDKRVDMSLTGGMSTNILVGNNVYLDNNSEKINVGETENVEPLNYAGILGFTFEVPLATRWDFVLEPRFRYYLNSFNKSSDISTHPYSLGIHSGVTFRF
jgi:hypothetical protein